MRAGCRSSRSTTCSATWPRCGSPRSRLEPPFACLLASGGHTLVLDVTDYAAPVRLGGTRDDAAGEAFDKGARLLGLSDPGGAALELVARHGDPQRFPFPLVLRGQAGHDLSFSGLKTALLRCVRELGDGLAEARADVAASYQAAIVGQLAERAEGALEASGHSSLAVVGGVAANDALRAALAEVCARRGARLCLLPPALCVDNAAMIGAAAFAAQALEPSGLPRARCLCPQPAGGVRSRQRAQRRVVYPRRVMKRRRRMRTRTLVLSLAAALAGVVALHGLGRSRHGAAGAALVGHGDPRRALRRAAAAAGHRRHGGAAGGLHRKSGRRRRSPERRSSSTSTRSRGAASG